METTNSFQRYGYRVVRNFLQRDICDKFTNYVFDMHEKGSLIRDALCPKSNAGYGLPPLDYALQKFTKNISSITGLDVLPTYSYTRIYRPGEVLPKHKDRNACEVSITLTLGYKSDTIWPIYLKANNRDVKVSLDVGDMVIYRGIDIPHWRNSFQGEWHVQAFFHYVDSNGPHKECYMDNRTRFGTINKRE